MVDMGYFLPLYDKCSLLIFEEIFNRRNEIKKKVENNLKNIEKTPENFDKQTIDTIFELSKDIRTLENQNYLSSDLKVFNFNF